MIPDRIKAALLMPMAIDIRFGLSVVLGMGEIKTHADSTLALEIYKDRRSAEESRIFSVQDERVKILSEEGINVSNTPKGSIAQVNLKGVMRSEGGLCSNGIDYTCDQVLQSANNPNVAGIVINTHSGGGEVVAAQRLSNAVKEASKIKPVVQYVNGMSASGAYWVGAHCDEILMGGRTTEVGSIGVVIQLDKPTIEWLNENLISIFSNLSPDKQDTMRAIMAGDYDFVKKHSLDPIAKEFHKIVKSGRSGIDESVLTGSMYSAPKAVKLGMADRIVGSPNDAIIRAAQLAKNRNRTNSAKKVLQHV